MDLSGMSQLEALPSEVLQSIVFYLTASSTLVLQATSSRFSDVTNEPLLWRQFCITDFQYWSAQHRIKRKLIDHSFSDWRKLYITRKRANRTTAQTIDRIIDSQVGQMDRIQKIVSLGYDAKDTLLSLFKAAESSPNILAQRYWTHVALGCLHRSLALDEWTALTSQEEGDGVFEKAIGAFDLFVLDEREQGDIDDIFDRLDYYASRVRQSFPEIDAVSPREKASIVAGYLLKERWTGIDMNPAVSYYALDHMFLGVALFSTRRNSIPLITVIIYCYVARKFGLRAAPCSFPWHVHAVVRPPIGYNLDGEPLPEDPCSSTTAKAQDQDEKQILYMDPFHTDHPIDPSTLHEQLNFIAHRFNPTQRSAFLTETTAQDITLRNARNIFNSPNQNPDPPVEPIDPHAAAYSAKWASFLIPSNGAQFRHAVAGIMDDVSGHFPYDIALIESHILPLTTNLPGYSHYQDVCRDARSKDLAPPVPKHRTAENAVVKYKVGQVFRHKRQGYIAAIVGWDHLCQQDERWIRLNSVDRLPDGRSQPFYHVVVQDHSIRYVAQENIEILGGVSQEDIARFPIAIGSYFRRWDHEEHVFLSNMEEEYPDN